MVIRNPSTLTGMSLDRGGNCWAASGLPSGGRGSVRRTHPRGSSRSVAERIASCAVPTLGEVLSATLATAADRGPLRSSVVARW
ncbi:MAG: hypothetical protein QOD62_1000, partial [Actinomycetota bacterium]|nr:hypothetical protein [Actinomycetota bacterium]